MEELKGYLDYSIDNLKENQIINKKIKELESEVKEYLTPKKDKTKAKTNSQGYVYLLRGENNKYKIGASKNPERRCKELCLSSCEKHELIHFFKAKEMFETEKTLHKVFKPKRSHSEWFSLSLEDVNYIKGLSNETA